MQTIQSQVNPRLLRKADRFFTGRQSGRIIELLQNARRAGARRVAIRNLLRRKLMTVLSETADQWRQVTIERDGRVRMMLEDGSEKAIMRPPA